MKNSEMKISVDEFWAGYSQILIQNKDKVSTSRNEEPTQERPISYNRFYKWTNGYPKTFPEDDIFYKVNTIIFESNNPLIWIQKTENNIVKSYIAQRFTPSKNHYDDILFQENLSIYDSYIISTTGTKRGISKSELINGIAALRFISTEDNLNNCASIPFEVIQGFQKFSIEILDKHLSQELIVERNGYLVQVKGNIRISSLQHLTNMKQIEAYTPYLHRFTSKIDFSINLSRSMNFSQIQILRKRINDLLLELPCSIESSDEDAIPISINISSCQLLFDAYVQKNDKKSLT